jgi:hypothetical protein
VSPLLRMAEESVSAKHDVKKDGSEDGRLQ